MKPQKIYDPVSALNTAKSLFGMAGEVFSKIPSGMEEGARYVAAHRGALTAGITVLALSIELYLKSLAMKTGSRAHRSHDLLALFDALPSALKASIIAAYDAKNSALPANIGVAFELCITPTDREPSPAEMAKALAKLPSGTDLRSILSAEKGAFITWRYFHEQDAFKQDELIFHRIQWLRLCLFVNAIQEHIKPTPMAIAAAQGHQNTAGS